MLDTLINKLRKNSQIDCAFLTGSMSTLKFTKHSDIDLIIILNKNENSIRTIYEIIDNTFADILFFDKSELEIMSQLIRIPANSISGSFIDWLRQSNILFDKSGLTSQLKDKLKLKHFYMEDDSINDAVQKISYNFIQNKRYYKSRKTAYLDALEVRLFYSIVELITGFMTLHNQPWRGEKTAIIYIKKKNPKFYGLFKLFQISPSLAMKFRLYERMVILIDSEFPLFNYINPVFTSKKKNSNEEIAKLLDWWAKIIK